MKRYYQVVANTDGFVIHSNILHKSYKDCESEVEALKKEIVAKYSVKELVLIEE